MSQFKLNQYPLVSDNYWQVGLVCHTVQKFGLTYKISQFSRKLLEYFYSSNDMEESVHWQGKKY